MDRITKIEDRISCIEDELNSIKNNSNNWYKSEFKDKEIIFEDTPAYLAIYANKEEAKEQSIKSLKDDLMHRNSIKEGGCYIGLNEEQSDRVIEILKHHKLI